MTATVEDYSPLLGVRSADIAEGSLVSASLPSGTRVCVGRHDGALFAVKDHCPHAEYPLSEGSLLPNGEIECCWHGARFDCRTGAVRRGPAEDDIYMFEVEEREGTLFVRRPPRSAK